MCGNIAKLTWIIIKLGALEWSIFNNLKDSGESIQLLNNTVQGMFNDNFPLIKIKISSRDTPYICLRFKHSYKIRTRISHRCGSAGTK